MGTQATAGQAARCELARGAVAWRRASAARRRRVQHAPASSDVVWWPRARDSRPRVRNARARGRGVYSCTPSSRRGAHRRRQRRDSATTGAPSALLCRLGRAGSWSTLLADHPVRKRPFPVSSWPLALARKERRLYDDRHAEREQVRVVRPSGAHSQQATCERSRGAPPRHQCAFAAVHAPNCFRRPASTPAARYLLTHCGAHCPRSSHPLRAPLRVRHFRGEMHQLAAGAWWQSDHASPHARCNAAPPSAHGHCARMQLYKCCTRHAPPAP